MACGRACLTAKSCLEIHRRFNRRVALVASAVDSRARYMTHRGPIAAADNPRRLMPACANAWVILAPRPGWSGPSTLSEWRHLVFSKPAFLAAPI